MSADRDVIEARNQEMARLKGQAHHLGHTGGLVRKTLVVARWRNGDEETALVYSSSDRSHPGDLKEMSRKMTDYRLRGAYYVRVEDIKHLCLKCGSKDPPAFALRKPVCAHCDGDVV